MKMQLEKASIERHDIVGVAHYAWQRSFARVTSNRKATASRGWSPLTYNLLDDAELRRDKSNNPVKHAYELCMIAGRTAADPILLNFEDGFSGTMMDKVVGYKVRQQALDRSRAENTAEINQQCKEKFQKCSTMTAGICFNSGNLCISDAGVRNRVVEETNKKKERELAAETRKKDAESALVNKVEGIRPKGLLPTQWDRKDLNTMVSWFKRPGDRALPSTKVQLLRRYHRTCTRSERDRTKLQEGEQPVLSDEEDGNCQVSVEVGSGNNTINASSGGGSNGLDVSVRGRINGIDASSGGGNNGLETLMLVAAAEAMA